MFTLPAYNAPDFNAPSFRNSPDAEFTAAEADMTAPDNFLATSIYPTYVKTGGKWLLVKKIRMDCVIVLQNGSLSAVEFRRLKKGDLVLTGRAEDGSGGIFVNYDPFPVKQEDGGVFSFRQSRTRESSYSQTYDELYEVLKHDRKDGFILWVMGPAAVFDYDSRKAFSLLIEKGYVNAVLAGNAFGTHDLEASYFNTALGQDVYTKRSVPNGHYHHIEILNKVRKSGSVAGFLKENNITDGVMYTLEKNKVPYVLAGSIRDDGPLPCVIGDAYRSQDEMRALVGKATTVVALATQLHTIATGNMTPCYFTQKDGSIRPVYFYIVDISEFALNKLCDRGSLSARGVVTNIQDFIVNLERNL